MAPVAGHAPLRSRLDVPELAILRLSFTLPEIEDGRT
jgi:hypothetical protein